MSALFDLHWVLQARSVWSTLAADVDAFKALFPEVDDEAILEMAHGVMAPAGNAAHMEFRPGYTPNDPGKLPIVIVTLNEEPIEEQALGHRTGSLGGGKVGEGFIVRQSITAHLMTSNAIATRLLHVALMGAMMAHRHWFDARGYIDMEYGGASDFSPSHDFMPEYLGAFGRTQRWSARAHVDFKTIAATPKSVVAASADMVDGDTFGGVVAVQQIG